VMCEVDGAREPLFIGGRGGQWRAEDAGVTPAGEVSWGRWYWAARVL
jgi:hypothetical protein